MNKKIRVVDKIEDFDIESFIKLESIVNERLWLKRTDLQDALEEYETDENGILNPATFMEYYTVNYRSIDSVFYYIVNGEIVAGCSLQNWSFNRVKLIDFVVTGLFEGRGIGSELLEYVINYCREKGFVEINLEVREGMPAESLYSKFGFERTHFLEDDMVDSDEECQLTERGISVPSQNCWAMELAL